MTHPPDDEALKRFLRQHRPAPPPASPALEERIMQAVATSAKPQRSSGNRRRSPLWVVSSAMAAGLLLTVVSYRRLLAPQPGAAELATLQTFLENNWVGLLEESSDDTLSLLESESAQATNDFPDPTAASPIDVLNPAADYSEMSVAQN